MLPVLSFGSVVSHHPESDPDNRENGYANVLGVGYYSWQLEGVGSKDERQLVMPPMHD